MRPRDTNKRKNNKASEERPARAAILLTSSRAPGPRTDTCPSSMMLPFPPALRFLGSRLRPSRSPEHPAPGFLSCRCMHFEPPEWTCSYRVPGPAVTSSAFASTCPHSLTHREASRRSRVRSRDYGKLVSAAGVSRTHLGVRPAPLYDAAL